MKTPNHGLLCCGLLLVIGAVSGCDESQRLPTQPALYEASPALAPALRIRDGDYVFRSINPFSSQQTNGYGINSEVEVVGTFAAQPDSTIAGSIGYHFEDGEFSRIRVPRSIGTAPQDINDHGVIVGFFAEREPDGTVGPHHGFRLKDHRYTRLPDPPAASSVEATAINTRGHIVGTMATPDGDRGFLFRHATYTLIDCGDESTQIEGINRGGDIVGQCGDNHGFLLHDGEFTEVDYPGAVETVARGINDQGDIVGIYALESDGADHGFLRDRDGNFKTIDFPGAEETKIAGINNRGDLVGTWVDEEGRERGFRAKLRRGSEVDDR